MKNILILLGLLLSFSVLAQTVVTSTTTTTSTTTSTTINLDSIVDARVNKIVQPQTPPPSGGNQYNEKYNINNTNGDNVGMSGGTSSGSNTRNNEALTNADIYKQRVSLEDELNSDISDTKPMYISHPRLQELCNKAYLQGMDGKGFDVDTRAFSSRKEFVELIEAYYGYGVATTSDNYTDKDEQRSTGAKIFLLVIAAIIVAVIVSSCISFSSPYYY